MPTLTEYASWCGHNDFAMHSKTVGSSVHSFPTTAGYETAERNLEKQSYLAEKAQTSIVRFASFSDPYPFKNEIWGGESYWKFIFAFFLNDQHSSSFHIIGKQMKIKYLRLAQTEAAHV